MANLNPTLSSKQVKLTHRIMLQFANPYLLARQCTSNTAHENSKMYISDSGIEDEVIHLFLYNREKPIVFSNQYKAQKEVNIPLIEYLY